MLVPMSVNLPHRILQKLPDAWRAELAAIGAEPITSGMSGANVFRLRTEPARFLKFADDDVAAQTLRQEIARAAWLAGHGVRVAPILRTHDDGRTAAMQTQALPGEPADRCDWPEARLLPAIGHALAQLHALPAIDCPFDESLAVRLKRARHAIEQGGVDVRHFASRNRNVTPRELFARVVANPPAEDFVVAHGDLTLSNMIISPDGAVGFIDCGHAGRADRYLDLGVLAAEIADHFGRRSVKTFARGYGVQRWNGRKAAYYADLYEFF
ncbi:MAG: APH(3') family aminoglycoside O-phosphotransferase [Rhizobiales bacterium]|nr:APH(3') family aminoglycoside O-phosphotransferase [Hyphomicrobiales bacterium]